MIKKIGILTSGGDAPGMNAAIAAVVREAKIKGIETYAVYDGYKGLVENNMEKIDPEFAISIMNCGGTAIGSARLPEFKEEKVRQVAVDNLKKEGIEALVVIGGDGSYMGAQRLTEMGINCIGLPGTIDNDIVSSDYTIGFDTALNTVVESIDKIRDTMQSHNRAAVVEIMGNGCGDLPLYAAAATGADIFSIPESKLTKEEILSQVKKLHDEGKRSVIVLVSEKMYDFTSEQLAKDIEAASGYVTRATVLGHVQRGGTPSAMDRVLATACGVFAVEQLVAGKGGLFVGLENGKLVARDIEATLNMPRKDKSQEIKVVRDINEIF
ncbi:6-phosphofructokinase [Mesoplasma lactucae]|uniref:ATP-dependent 6-phosphofructokinase n=1 Tax=Mesoplasma lactucae ATCC 49193 TaxID=81460 RepID=A0A291IR08_9MOLU|nr:6-phosphofructokinase [Mesoplasma lactucae]ATG97229.1 6-phosphofructokinase [Mesoplasma lactucae ATCC 49193]ATZ20329.1 6-phosphofructokinase [Mesoplasma lactucae ATCC 49193]MCL8216500.1 ATP-dependent 6-phosphofructokinase isozyme 1 [Mesoplasma lactucae ATCC 49193]